MVTTRVRVWRLVPSLTGASDPARSPIRWLCQNTPAPRTEKPNPASCASLDSLTCWAILTAATMMAPMTMMTMMAVSMLISP